MSKNVIYDKPMTKAQKNKRYKDKIKQWSRENYKSFSFHIPNEIVDDFRETAKANGESQRGLIVEFMINYIEKGKNKNE